MKNITTGEGGAIAFREQKHATLAKLQRNHGINKSDIDGLDDALSRCFPGLMLRKNRALTSGCLICVPWRFSITKLENGLITSSTLEFISTLLDDKDHFKLARKRRCVSLHGIYVQYS